jgi:hypothetical protein
MIHHITAPRTPTMLGHTSLNKLPLLRDFTSHRESSYDRTGGNEDYLVISPNQRRVIADLRGAGCVKHIWMTLAGGGPAVLREVVLRMHWDGQNEPSVECPLGDFFGMGHGLAKNFVSLPLQMSPAHGRGFNCWWSMPFRAGAKIEVDYRPHLGEAGKACQLFYYIDYESYPSAGALDGAAYFHTQWNRRADNLGWAYQEFLKEPQPFDQAAFYKRIRQDPRYLNTSGQDNYVILDTPGNGIYCGAHLDIDCHTPNPNQWYGEGDDMIYIDGQRLPSLHGTGTEDWCNTAWCPQEEYSAPYHGIILYSGKPGDPEPWRGRNTLYRYHIEDPIRFRKSIRVTIEQGHANKLNNDYSSTAYFYLASPRRGGRPLPPVAERLPRGMEG